MRLIDADALHEDITNGDGTSLQKFFADCCVAAAPTINPYKWISVDDRLPEKETLIKWRERTGYNSIRVLCVCKQKSGKVMVKEGYCEMWDDSDYGPYWKIPGSIDSVTHWMPLPTPPTEKEN
jgi:hypothetical protein